MSLILLAKPNVGSATGAYGLGNKNNTNQIKNCQHNEHTSPRVFSFDNTYHSPVFFLLCLIHWIEKWRSHGHALEHLILKIFMMDLLYVSCVNEKSEKQRTIIPLKINIKGFSHFQSLFFFFFLHFRFTTKAKDSKHAWSLFGANNS